MAMAASGEKERHFLDHFEAYLARRDGVDKLLKIARYASKLALSSPNPPPVNIAERLRAFESSVGTTRKAFRLGKFVQDVNALRSSKHGFSTKPGLLELIAYGGEGIYYFLEQFVWLCKAGLIDKRRLKMIQRWSAWSELIGYFASILLKSSEVRSLMEKEAKLVKKSEEQNTAEMKELKMKRFMKTLSIIQDIADGMIAVNDIRNGLASAFISTHKIWLST